MSKKITIDLEEYKELLKSELSLRVLRDVGRIHKIGAYDDAFNDEHLAGYFPDLPNDEEGLFDLKLRQIHAEAEAKSFEEF